MAPLSPLPTSDTVAAARSVQDPHIPPAHTVGKNARASISDSQAATHIRIHKAARTLDVWAKDHRLVRIAGIQLGRNPVGPKRFQGDSRTPEGRFVIDWRNPQSAYYLSLHISYPTPEDVAFARRQGRSAGGMIMIHGQPNGYEGRVDGDWTDGCIAVSDQEIEMLWRIVPDGTEVEIFP